MANDVAKRSTETHGVMWEPTTKTDEEVLDFLIRSRVKLLISAPFFGTIAVHRRQCMVSNCRNRRQELLLQQRLCSGFAREGRRAGGFPSRARGYALCV